MPGRDLDLRRLLQHCRIVLTGASGAGKTTAADLFRREIGNRVVPEPEVAYTMASCLALARLLRFRSSDLSASR